MASKRHPPVPHGKTSAEAFGQQVPGVLLAAGTGSSWSDILVEIYARQRVEDRLVVPAVAEPLIVWVLSGRALVEEREPGGTWTGRAVCASEFFLTTSPTPYELRWRVTSPENLETLHAYLSLPILARAHEEVLGGAEVPRLREVFGARDPVLSALLEQLRSELLSRPRPSALFIQGIAQSLAVHLVRTYSELGGRHGARGRLPAYARALSHLLPEGTAVPGGVMLPRAYWEAVFARVQGDVVHAQAAFEVTRVELAKTVAARPDAAVALSFLGLIDAGLGRKEDALAEGRHACELLPISKDAVAGPFVAANLAQIYAWTGEKTAAVESLTALLRVPGQYSYGLLKLDPEFDDLRGDEGFEALLASLAPKSAP